MKKISLMEALEGIEDTRRERSVWYPLHEVLFIMLMAVICGATSYAKVEMFGKSREKWLKKYLKLEYGIPDACTFRNVIKAIDTRQLHTVFVEWMQNVVKTVTGVVAVDGKQARRTKSAKKKPLHVVSAFSTEFGLVLGQLAYEHCRQLNGQQSNSTKTGQKNHTKYELTRGNSHHHGVSTYLCTSDERRWRTWKRKRWQ